MTDAFLSQLHSNFGVAAGSVIGLAESATGKSVATVDRVVAGYDNEVYRVQFHDQQTVFVRISRNTAEGSRPYDGEVWAMEQARQAGLPVPAVLLLSEVADAEQQLQAMVVEAATGQPMEDALPRLNSSQRQRLLGSLGRSVALLHSVRAPGVWRPDDHGRWPDPMAVRQGFIANRRGETNQLVAAGFSSVEIDRILVVLEQCPHTPPLNDFVLCHGDLSPDHLFSDDAQRVSSIIDWGGWRGSSRIEELAYICSWVTTTADRTALLDGYGIPSQDQRDLQASMAMSLINQLIGQVAHHVEIGDQQGTANVAVSLRRALSELAGC